MEKIRVLDLAFVSSRHGHRCVDCWAGVRLPFAGSGCVRVSSFFCGIIPHALIFSFYGKASLGCVFLLPDMSSVFFCTYVWKWAVSVHGNCRTNQKY